MRERLNNSDYHLSTYNLDGNKSDEKPEPEEESSSTGEDRSEEDLEASQEQEATVEFKLDQLPDELQETMEGHIEFFSDSGVTVIGLGRMDLDLDEESELTSLENAEEIDISLEDVNVVEMFCEVGDTRFVYSFLPNRSYNGIEIQYNVLQELFLLSGVDALDDMDDMERVQAVNMLEDILSQKDLGAVLRSNRTLDRTDLVAWINIVRSQNADFIHVLDYTPEGEVVGSRIEKRIYLPEKDIEKEECLHRAVQEITNISRSYSGLLGLAYLENGVRIPDSIGEKVRAAVSEEDWSSYNSREDKDHIRGFQ